MSNEQDYLTRTNNGTSFSGSDVKIFSALTLASALRLYAKTGMKATRMHTPANMFLKAKEYTGKTYKRGQYEQAAVDLTEYANNLKSQPRTEE